MKFNDNLLIHFLPYKLLESDHFISDLPDCVRGHG